MSAITFFHLRPHVQMRPHLFNTKWHPWLSPSAYHCKHNCMILKNKIIFFECICDTKQCILKGKIKYFLFIWPVIVNGKCIQLKPWISQCVLYWPRKLFSCSQSPAAVPTCTRMHCGQVVAVTSLDVRQNNRFCSRRTLFFLFSTAHTESTSTLTRRPQKKFNEFS